LAGKLVWLGNLFGTPFRDYLMGPNKHFLARDGAVLIDDNDDKCIKFVEYGGNAILFPQKWNALKNFQGDPYEFVAQALEKLEAA
jgi:hypothetical protein